MARFRGRRLGRGPRQRVNWVTGIFSASLITDASTVIQYVMLDASDWQGDTASLNKPCLVRRVIGSFLWLPTWLSTSLAQANAHMTWAVHTLDNEDTDASILSTAAGQVLTSERVVATGVDGMAYWEVPSANWRTSWAPPLRVNFDTRVNIKLMPDQLLLLTCQLGASVEGALQADTFFSSGISRVLIREP